ncbi:phage tail protein [Faecalicatena contorta]|uniref:phage tail protein n=1 Tax=Faecalicatena contorta TaxID=39482 RepID=UPI001F2B9B52|nr:hypothetical protein [Faecalicatena contorta]MCF2555747.1 hypothetical protein [Faecalicatena contorta]
MATELAQAYVQIIPSAQGISGGIQKVLDPEAETSGSSFGGKLVGTIKKVIATAAIGKVLKASITEGADLEQSLGGIETLFKNSADKVKANAMQAYKTAGMSANEYMELTTSFSASLLQSLSGDTSKAADIADMAMVDMSDNANKMGSNMEDIKNAYQGFAKQNYTMLDNLKLGYGGTKTEMERLLTDAQKITGVKYDINNLSDVYSAIHVIQGELGITGTTSKEAATTLSGSFNSMKAAFKNVMGEIALGMDIGPAINALADTTVTFLVGNLLPAIWNIVTALPGGIIAFIQALVPQVVTELTRLLTSIQEQFPVVLQTGVDMITNFANGILQGAPGYLEKAGVLITEFVNAVIAKIPIVLSAGAELILNLVNGIINNLPQIISSAATAIAGFITGVGQNLPSILQSGIEIIGKLAAGLVRAIPNLVAQIPTIITSIRTTFSNVDWAGIGRNIISGIATGLRNAGSQLWDAVKGILGNFKDKVLEFFGIHSPSTWGIYVGKMVDTGIAKGIADNTDLVSMASNELKKMTMNPFEISDLSYRVTGDVSNDNAGALERLDVLISLLRIIVNKDTTVTLNNREVIRILRDMGVVFA